MHVWWCACVRVCYVIGEKIDSSAMPMAICTHQSVLRIKVAEGAKHPGGGVQVDILRHQLGQPEVRDLPSPSTHHGEVYTAYLQRNFYCNFFFYLSLKVLGEEDVAGLEVAVDDGDADSGGGVEVGEPPRGAQRYSQPHRPVHPHLSDPCN